MNIVALRTLAASLVATLAFAAQPASADPTTATTIATTSASQIGTSQVGIVYHLPVSIELPRFQTTRPTSSLPPLSRTALYIVQAIDAAQSARALRVDGAYERNPLMRPFSHAGAVGMAAGFALGDVARNLLFRHASEKVKLAADAAQAASNVEGILSTHAALSALHP